jgi:hypothetical protein
MSQPTDFPIRAPCSPVTTNRPTDASLSENLAESRSLDGDDSWVPPLRDRPGHDPAGFGTKLGWPRSSARVGGEESASGHHLIDTEPGGNQRDEPLPEIPGFVILGECGRGGMGVVYLAEQVDLGRRVALKFLKPELAGSMVQRTRLMVEATALARLQHPNIVQIFSSGTHEGRSFIVQEFVGGESLHKKLAHQPASALVAARVVATLARAVEHAHRQRIIHRDLKPSNVLLTVDGIPKISDFGLAKLSDVGGEANQTQSGTIVGSPSYMAPEQSLGKPGAVAPPADIYSLGAILYEMLTARPPFLASSTLETLEQVHTADPVSPRQLQPKLPRDIATICLKCLRKDPAHRYATAAALADDLDRLLEGRPILARPASWPIRLAKWVKRRPATAASLAVAVLAAIALLAGGLIYQSLLRAALKRAEENALVARDQKSEADARYRLARETLNKMLDRFGARDFRQTPGLKELQRQQLADALGFYRDVVKGRINPNPAVRFEAGEAALQSGQAQLVLGRMSEGYEQINQAIAIFENLLREDPARAEYRLALALSYRSRSFTAMPPPVSNVSPSNDGASTFDLDRSRELLEKLLAQYPENRTYRAELAITYHNLGTYYSNRLPLDLAKAEPSFREAVNLRRSLLDNSPSEADAPLRVLMAESLQGLAVIIQQKERKEEVPRLYAESRKLLEHALRVEPKWDEATLSLGLTLLSWGDFLRFDPASHSKAENLLAQAIEHLAPIVEREPEWSSARMALLNSHGALAALREADGRYVEAAREREKVVAISKPENKEEAQFFLAMALARAGEHRKAWSFVVALRPSLTKRPADYHFHLAVVCSVCAGAAEKDPGLSPEDHARLGSIYGAAGVELLRDALALLPEAERTERRLAQLGDPDMAPIRPRADFQALVADTPTAPKPKQHPSP